MIPTTSTNGHAVPRTSKPSKPTKPTATKARSTKQTAVTGRGNRVWAQAGIGLSLTLSAGLNGLAFAEHASSPVLAWGLGVTIPALVLVFSRVSAGAWEQGRRGLAGAGALAASAVLVLSVQHLAVSISRITGEHVAVSALLAVAIDLGLVVWELFTLRK